MPFLTGGSRVLPQHARCWPWPASDQHIRVWRTRQLANLPSMSWGKRYPQLLYCRECDAGLYLARTICVVRSCAVGTEKAALKLPLALKSTAAAVMSCACVAARAALKDADVNQAEDSSLQWDIARSARLEMRDFACILRLQRKPPVLPPLSIKVSRYGRLLRGC